MSTWMEKLLARGKRKCSHSHIKAKLSHMVSCQCPSGKGCACHWTNVTQGHALAKLFSGPEIVERIFQFLVTTLESRII